MKWLLLSLVALVLSVMVGYAAPPEDHRNVQIIAQAETALTPGEYTQALSSQVRIVGNKVSKRYHLPGMPFYDKVRKERRVYFETEQEAIAAGYYKSGTGKDLTGKPPSPPPAPEAVMAPAAQPTGDVPASEPAAVLPAAPAPEAAQTAVARDAAEKPPAPASPPVEASDPSSSPPLDKMMNLTLADCLEIAFAQNRMRAVSRESIKIAEAQHKQALSGHWPQLKASLTAMRMDEDPTFVFPSQSLPLGEASRPFAEAIANAQLAKLGITPDSVGLDAYNNALNMATNEALNHLNAASMPEQKIKLMDRDLLTMTLSLIYPLYTGGKISALARQAKAGVEVSREEARQTDFQIIRDIKQYYYGHILAGQISRMGRAALEQFEATQTLTENLYQHGSGRVKKTDYLRTKVMTSAVRSAIEVLKSNEELSLSALANTMGLAWNTPIAVAKADIPFTPSGGNLDELVAWAHQNNPQMHSVRLGLDAREAKVSEARSGHLPMVALFGNLSRLENAYDGGMVTEENRNSWQIGVSVELPIFNGFRTSKEVQEAKLRLEKLKHQSLLLSEGVALQVKAAFLQIARSEAQVRTLKEALDAAAENRQLTVRAYAQELVETKDIIEAQLLEFVMHGQYLKALYDHQVNVAQLEYWIGKSIYE